MSMQGVVRDGDWTIGVSTELRPDGAFECRVHVLQRVEPAPLRREFVHGGMFRSEQDAMLDGLHEGMMWIARRRGLARPYA
ncbi:hypothetical protein ACS0ZG_14885 [Burkholderia gladioli]|uniref:UDP-glucose 4-epimerase n=2 Tax=Burkholderia gladioli TaxID=28095 RepID=F2L8K2_BURGS|nr:hypothetical protein [Burkholderia gladioli]AEA60773.1 hypothetical protein bgla_1g21390 [Burkholderia gladioli BSR3]ATF84177.1 hypothetical protein CO712_03300 [Burkholderia gladioli pv. gladioli]KKJ05173.1 hypothetical protein XF14_17765 [Burkholderia gladioli]MBJ9713781.1 hypothetical protein [Burkholderia gladioli]MBU9155670.1 hypothetical protein [Burkholderia gladioli]